MDDRGNGQSPSDEELPAVAKSHEQPIAVSVRGVSKTFRLGATSKTFKERLIHRREHSNSEFRAVDNISFDVKQGETFGIIGHNGSGKSTLLKLISGIMRPSEGDILVRGRLAALLELGAGFHPDLTGTENIYLNGSILGFSEAYVRDAYDDIVDFAELEEFIETPVKHYSSGMHARLGFAVATHLEPDVLLLDEILAVGDESFKRKCMERVHRFRGLGRTMVLVSHSASTVAQLCDRCAVVAHGELLFLGDSDEAITVHRRALSTRAADRADRGANGAAGGPDDQRVATVRTAGSRFDSDDREPSIKPGQDLKLLSDIEVLEEQEFRIRLSLRTEEGLVLLNRASTGLLGAPLQLPVGRHRIAFTLHELPLRDGRYIADVILESPDGSRRLDRDGGAASFRVASGKRGLGLVAIDLSCEVLDESDRSPNGRLAEGAAQTV